MTWLFFRGAEAPPARTVLEFRVQGGKDLKFTGQVGGSPDSGVGPGLGFILNLEHIYIYI